jgi:pimeloyl-ACP methyl ester carboxylesterase
MTNTSTRPASLLFDVDDGEGQTTRVALIHGIGASSPQQWAAQSAHEIASWWTRVDRSRAAKLSACPSGCRLALGHVHLQLGSGADARKVVLEPLYWAGSVSRPSAGRCAWLVLRVGLLIGLVDVAAAWLTLLRRPVDDVTLAAMTHGFARLLIGLGRALLSPLLALAATGAVLLSARMRESIGDALAWTLDAASHERVLDKLTRALDAHSGPLVLVGHSQGGSIAAALEPRLRAGKRDVWLVTLGSGHGLLTTMGSILPRWSLLKSLVCWGTVLVFVIFLTVATAEVIVSSARPLGVMLEWVVKLGGYAWLTSLVPTTPLHQLVMQGAHTRQQVGSEILQFSLSLPAGARHAEIASCALAVLLITVGIDTARRLHKATLTAAPGIDVVATHDLVAATMLQLSPPERLRRIGQCGSIMFDHTSYLRNAWSVLPLIAEQIEHASGLRPSRTIKRPQANANTTPD